MRVAGRQCDTGEPVTAHVRAGRIAALRPGCELGALGGLEHWLSPGFLDLQLNGYAGHDFNADTWAHPDEVSADLAPIFASAARAGTPLFCPTVTTSAPERMLARLAALRAALEADPRLRAAVPGVHVEGPWLSPEDGPRGAHPREHLSDPDWELFQRFQEAAGGGIRMVTLAPELPGALPFIERLAAAGVVVALGHTGAEPETVRNAVHAGATVSTHLGNGAHAQIRRHPNYLWEQLACDALFATVIADGHHLPDAVLKCVARVKGAERLALVSDAVSLGGMPAGQYAEGRHEVLPSGSIVVAGTPYLAGAGHLLDTCVATMLRAGPLTLAEVARCASTIPARILGLEHRKGHLRVGYDADLTLFRLPAAGALPRLEIRATVRAGELAYTAA